MKITKKQLHKLIKECACEAMKDVGMDGLGMAPPMPKMIKVIKLGEPQIKAGLFPGLGMKHDHEDHHDDQGEKSMILANLARMSEKSQELHGMAADIDDNEEWVQEKIAVASAMIDSIYNYLKYRDQE